MTETRLPLTVVIPTYRRERVLVETINYLLPLLGSGDELIVLDQTTEHEVATESALASWHESGRIRWQRLPEPSIPRAMNQGLLLASRDVVLFVDDDIKPEPGLLVEHMAAHGSHGDVIVAGRVIQPWHEGVDFSAGDDVHLAGLRQGWIKEFIGCNFSVRRLSAIALGGFDENFIRVAYRYEAEFAHRFCAAGRRIWFEPTACLHHLKAANGGTRTYGEHLTTWRPDHAVGAYYFALRTGAWRELLARPFRSVMTRFHLRRPWRIVVTLWAEVRGLIWALRLRARGPRYVTPAESRQL